MKTIYHTYFKVSFIMLIGFMFVFHPNASANITRTVEPVIVMAKDLPDNDAMFGANLENILGYVYNKTADTWTRIPLQIDEFNKAYEDDMQYFHPDNILGENDELVFMAADAGDKAPMEAWIGDATTQPYTRYELALIDDTNNDTGYVYLFRTDNAGSHPAVSDYVDWRVDETRGELVTSANYEIGHDVHGHMSNLIIPTEKGGLGVDFFDRMKIRVVGQATFLGQNLDVNMNEGALEGGEYTPNIIDGPVRVIRKWNFDVRIDELGGYKIGPYNFIIKYYPYTADYGNATFSLGGSVPVNIDYVRLSFDLNSRANGMKMFAPKITAPGSNFPDGVPIDMLNDTGVIPRDLDVPGWTWWMQTGGPGTFLAISYLPKIGKYQYLYYKDDDGGTNDPASIPSNDTGDGQSWGDTGFKVIGPLAEASIPLGAQLYFLGPNISQDSAATIEMYKEVPLKIQVNQNDNVAPAQISDVIIHEFGINDVSLSWTAVGDDGQIGGPASYYIMRYSDQPVDNLWEWWAAAKSVRQLPAPSTPGERDSTSIDGLDRNKMYYFVLRAVDEAGNAGPVSEATFGTTTPVELVSFHGASSSNGVELNWLTATEQNNLGFAIHRKVQDDEWQQVGFVKGAGTTNQEQVYYFVDQPGRIGDYKYRLEQIDTNGDFQLSDVITIKVVAPEKFNLAQNYPNPFNPTTKINFDLPASVEGQMELAIYDMLGRKVKSLVNKQAQPGQYSFEWDGTTDLGQQASSGVYVYTLQAGTFRSAKKMIKLQ